MKNILYLGISSNTFYAYPRSKDKHFYQNYSETEALTNFIDLQYDMTYHN